MERAQTLWALHAEWKKWEDLYFTACDENKRKEKERADARRNEVVAVALLLGFTGAEILGSPFIAGSEADDMWKAEHAQTVTH